MRRRQLQLSHDIAEQFAGLLILFGSVLGSLFDVWHVFSGCWLGFCSWGLVPVCFMVCNHTHQFFLAQRPGDRSSLPVTSLSRNIFQFFIVFPFPFPFLILSSVASLFQFFMSKYVRHFFPLSDSCDSCTFDSALTHATGPSMVVLRPLHSARIAPFGLCFF